jgi:signal transduction histidine kinase
MSNNDENHCKITTGRDEMLNGSQVNLILVFFIYGLAFFSMGLALMLESGRSPLLAGASILLPLALFGILHGIHEWLEMTLQATDWLGLQTQLWLASLRLVILIISFSLLIIFGLVSLRPERRFSRADAYVSVGLLALYITLVVLVYIHNLHNPNDWVRSSDVLARYLLAVPGAILASLALGRRANQAKAQQRYRLARSLAWAAAGFAVYGVSQLFVPVADFFPANIFNSTMFLNMFGAPIQVVRAVVAVVITVSLIRAIQAVEEERQKEFLAVQQARLDALEQVRRDLFERDTLRRELLRHMVIAQEEEKTRIARELHDETAQILTAFSLNLATLRELMPSDLRLGEFLTRLQELSRRMSRGIYRMVHDLRPAQLDDLGLASALNYLADETKKNTGLDVVVEIIGARHKLDPLVETVLFRVAQEALLNAARYAEVKQALVRLVFTSAEVNLQVRDEGVGFDVNERQVPPQGWGLAGMRERAESIGAQLRIVSTKGQGTLVEVGVPNLAATEAPVKTTDDSAYAEKVM